MNFVADVLNEEPEEVRANIRALSLTSSLVPEYTHETLDKQSTLSELRAKMEEPEFVEALRSIKATFHSRLRRAAETGRRAQQHLVEANPRLVLGIAEKYSGSGVSSLD